MVERGLKEKLSRPNPELQGPKKNGESPENSHPLNFGNSSLNPKPKLPKENKENRTSDFKGHESPPPVELDIPALRDFLSGSSDAPPFLDSRDPLVRQAIAAELLVVMSDVEEKSDNPDEQYPDGLEAATRDVTDQHLGDPTLINARQLFIDYGYLDEAIDSLRANDSPALRANAARILGTVGSKRGTAPLIAALFDDSPEVRKAAEDALGRIGDPSVSIGPMDSMISGRSDYPPPQAVDVSPIESGAEPAIQSGESPDHTSNATFLVEPASVVEPGPGTGSSPSVEELNQIKKEITELERQLVEVVAARQEADKEALVRAEQESAFRAEAAARRREDEEARKRAEEKAARRRSEDDRKMAAELLGRLQAELEAQRLAEEEERLRVEAGTLRQTAGTMACEIAEHDAREFSASAGARLAEAEKALRRAEEIFNAELKRLRTEEEATLRATEEAERQRLEVEAQRVEAENQVQRIEAEKQELLQAVAARDSEIERLREAQATARQEQEELSRQVTTLDRTREEIAARQSELEAESQRVSAEADRLYAAEKAYQAAEAERLQLQAELTQQLENEQRLLADVRQQSEAEQQRLEEAFRERASQQDRRIAELQALRTSLQAEAEQRAEKELQLNAEIEHLRVAEKEAMSRIVQFESLRARAEETHLQAAEKVQKIEAEARRRTMEDQRVLDKLEETRRNLDLEAHARAEQEKHLKEEIESLRKQEKDERQRIAEIASSRAEAEVRLHRERERLKLEEEALAKTESQIEYLLEPPQDLGGATEWFDDPEHNLRSLQHSSMDEVPVVLTEEFASTLPESLLADISSADPDKRMAALDSWARNPTNETFSVIARCFDDPAPQVRNTAARALRDSAPERTVESFTMAIEEGSVERVRNIGVAIAESGLAAEALQDLRTQSREDTYKALSLLFVMAKAGEIQPLLQAIEEHPESEICSAAVKLLNLSGQTNSAEAALQRRLEKLA